MERIPLLSEIDDEKHYAQLLEVAYVEAYVELRQILIDGELITHRRPGCQPESTSVDLNFETVERLTHVMKDTVQQSVDRRKRLADVTAGLADVVLDVEGTEE